jgi:hypothetical protein
MVYEEIARPTRKKQLNNRCEPCHLLKPSDVRRRLGSQQFIAVTLMALEYGAIFDTRRKCVAREVPYRIIKQAYTIYTDSVGFMVK